MKTQVQILKISAREVIAWLVLTFAVLLFGITVTFAQGTPAREDGKIRIRIEKEENGKKMKVDTTFDAKDKDRVQAYVNSLDEEFDSPPIPPIPPAPKGLSHERRHDNDRSDPFDETDREKLHETMGQLRLEMKDLEEELGGMHMEAYLDSSVGDFPPFEMEQEEPGPGAATWKRHGCCIQVNIDSLTGEDRVLILGDGENEDHGDTHVFENRTDDGHGDRVIIIRKTRKKSGSPDKPGEGSNERLNTHDSKLLPLHLESFPNPGDGRFTLKFSLEKKGDTAIRITDATGKEVYSESRKNFSGDYSKQMDISNQGKGAYLLTITQDGQAVTKKIVVE